MLALRMIWVAFLSFVVWGFAAALTGTWWAGLIVIAGLVVYAITDQNAKQKRVRVTYREMIAAQERARQAAPEAAIAAAEAEVANAQLRILRERP